MDTSQIIYVIIRHKYLWYLIRNQIMTKFATITCSICGKQISKAGAAYTSHARMHVKRGEAIEFKSSNGLLFMSEAEHKRYIDEHPYAMLGEEPLPGQPRDIWEIPDVSQEICGETGQRVIDPSSYFVTSGEAVKKAQKMVKDLYSAAVKARAFRDKLKKARGIKKYLETTREDRRLLVKCKDPKKKGN
jgi:hypothetical protein